VRIVGGEKLARPAAGEKEAARSPACTCGRRRRRTPSCAARAVRDASTADFGDVRATHLASIQIDKEQLDSMAE
jgi:hypothetical protein